MNPDLLREVMSLLVPADRARLADILKFARLHATRKTVASETSLTVAAVTRCFTAEHASGTSTFRATVDYRPETAGAVLTADVIAARIELLFRAIREEKENRRITDATERHIARVRGPVLRAYAERTGRRTEGFTPDKWRETPDARRMQRANKE